MTKREALQILIKHAAANIAGAGTGIRGGTGDAEKREVRDAITKIYPDAYGRKFDQSDEFNLRLPYTSPNYE